MPIQVILTEQCRICATRQRANDRRTSNLRPSVDFFRFRFGFVRHYHNSRSRKPVSSESMDIATLVLLLSLSAECLEYSVTVRDSFELFSRRGVYLWIRFDYIDMA